MGGASSDESLGLYLRYGGLPCLRKPGKFEDETALEYLGGVFDSVVLKDIVLRHRRRRNPAILARIAEFVADSIGSPTSARNVANYLKSQGIESPSPSSTTYFSYLEESYAVRRVKPEDLQASASSKAGTSCYFEDLRPPHHEGARLLPARARQGRRERGFPPPRLDGWTVHSGRVGAREVDFMRPRGRAEPCPATCLSSPTRRRGSGSSAPSSNSAMPGPSSS